MSAASILAIIQLVSVLAPPAIELVNNLINIAKSNNMTEDEVMEMLTELQTTLKPMELKP